MSIPKDLKKLEKVEGKSSVQLAGELAAQTPKRALKWIAKPMNARIDLEDQEAVWAALTAEEQSS
jgi:hypothetical protein